MTAPHSGDGVGVFSGAGSDRMGGQDPLPHEFKVGDLVIIRPRTLEEVKKRERSGFPTWCSEGRMRKHMGHPGVVDRVIPQVWGSDMRTSIGVAVYLDHWSYAPEDLEPLKPLPSPTTRIELALFEARSFGFNEVGGFTFQEREWFIEEIFKHVILDP